MSNMLRAIKKEPTLFLVDKYKIDVNYPNHIKCVENCTCVYLFLNESSGLCKIGVTNNPRTRLRQLECSSGMSLSPLIFIELQPDYDENAHFLEKYLHEYFKSKRQFGEWFNLSIRDIIQIKNLFWFIEGENIIDNVKFYLTKSGTYMPF